MTTTSYNIYQQITSVRLASTINLSGNYFNGALNNGVGATLTALSVGTLSIDNVLVEVGDRLLLKDQTLTNQNGLYVVQTIGSPNGLWMIERSSDFQSLEQLKVGQYFSVGAGDTLAGSMYVLVEPLPNTIGMGNFTFINVADESIPAGPYLLKSNNLSDVNNSTIAIENIGLGRPGILILTDSDFAAGGGTYTLTNPPPIYISMSTTSTGRILQLPPQNEVSSLQASQNITLLTGNPSQAININNGSSTLIFQVGQDSAWQAVPNDRTTIDGAWVFLGIVQTLSAVTGTVELTSNDSSVVITPDPTTQTVDLSAAAVANIVYEQLYVNAASGNDSNSGSILEPMATYDAARLLALSLGASINNPFVVNLIGPFSVTGDVVISPFVSVIGTSSYSSRISFTGHIVLDSLWNSITSPFTVIRNLNLIGSLGINFIYTVFQGGSFIRFQDCSFQYNSIAILGSGTNTACETVIFNNCNTDGTAEPTINVDNINLELFNTNPSNDITVSCVSTISQARFVLTGSQTRTGNITLDAPSTGTLTTTIGSSNTFGKTLTINGSSHTVNIDSTSYQFTLVLTGGATLSNLVTPTLTDGMVNTSYTPSSYTPTGGSSPSFSASSVTGNLKGIDLALASIGGNVVPSEMIFVDAINGNDSNNGEISQPLKTYGAATTLAVSRTPAYGASQVIVLMTSISITGNMSIFPYVSILGLGKYSTVIGMTGNVVFDTSWGTVSLPNIQIMNVSFVTKNFNLVYSAYKAGSFIRFENCSFQLDDAGEPFAVVGSNGSGTALCETVIFQNCSLDLQTGVLEPHYELTNVNSYFFNTRISTAFTALVSSATVQANLIIEDCVGITSGIIVHTSSTGTLNTIISGSSVQGTLLINGANNSVSVDSTSYQFSGITLTGGASISNLSNTSLSDGVRANQNFSPVNYTPVQPVSTVSDDSVTGNLLGIDNALGVIESALPKASGTVTLVGGSAIVSSSVVASGDSIQLTRTASGGTPGFPVITYNAGVSFTITSTSALDTSTFKWKNLGA